MALPELTRDGDVFVMHLTDDDNRFNRAAVDAMHRCLDQVDATEGPKGFVTVGAGKFFSNGLDLDWLAGGEEPMVPFIADVMRLWARILEAPYPTVAAINGHAFAGGAMFALAFDQRVMRADRGFWCVNEVLLGMNLPPGMAAILQAKLTPQIVHEAVTQAHRFGADEALAGQIVDAVADETAVLPDAVARAASLGHTTSPALGQLKQRLYGPTLELLRNNELPSSDGTSV